MNNDTVNTTQETTASGAGNDRTFTQEEVNRIVQDRLSRERSKTPSETEKTLQEREAALAKREREIAFKAVMKEKDIPEEVYEALNCTSEETFNKALEILSPYFQKAKEPIRHPVAGTRSSGSFDSIRKAMGLK